MGMFFVGMISHFFYVCSFSTYVCFCNNLFLFCWAFFFVGGGGKQLCRFIPGTAFTG